VLLVGINPGVTSALTGHHFAGPTNRFWRLLYESGIVPEPVTHEDDVRLPEWGLGMTNLVARPSPGIDVLKPAEYIEGWRILEQKIARYRPDIVAFVGVTMYRALWKVLGHTDAPDIKPGFQKTRVYGARMFVLPNPSGRNANFSYAEMLQAFRSLRRALRRLPGRPGGGAKPRSARARTASEPRERSGAGASAVERAARSGGAPASERVGESAGRSARSARASGASEPRERSGAGAPRE
jgi:TDG/mug DNA glycosylase family protein